MASLQFKATRNGAFLIPPFVPTLKEFLYLSNIDDQGILRFHIHVFQFYQFKPSMKSDDPTRVIREGLIRVLVFYYPLDERVRYAPTDKLVVKCMGEGVLFVEADANVALEEFKDLQLPYRSCKEFLYDVHGLDTITNSHIIFIKVMCTRCRGFILATTLNHIFSDAGGLIHFISALARNGEGSDEAFGSVGLGKGKPFSKSYPPTACTTRKECGYEAPNHTHKPSSMGL